MKEFFDNWKYTIIGGLIHYVVVGSVLWWGWYNLEEKNLRLTLAITSSIFFLLWALMLVKDLSRFADRKMEEALEKLK